MPTPYHVRLAVSQYGEQFRAELFTEDLGDTEGDVLAELPPSLAEWVPYLAQGADLPPDAARQLGKDLFAALLGQPENAKKWAEVLAHTARKKQPIRLLIDATTEAVRDLPYGLLCEPHDDWFLFHGNKHAVEFVRILRRCSPRPLRLRARLRVLVAVAEPRSADVPPFDAARRLQKLAAARCTEVDLVVCGPDGPTPLAGIADPAAFAPYTRTTRDALRQALTGEFDVFHLLAHGHGAGVLLCAPDGAPAETTASELGDWCGAGRTALAFLQVCKAGQSGGRGGFGGVAQQLLNPRGGNLAAVVASTFPLDAEHSTDAAVGFYRQLAAGRPPEEALTADRPESDWCWAFLELWARPGALGGTRPRAAFQFVSPYRGLSSFAEQDADLFFGRTAEVAEVMQILRAEPAVAVVGDSGSGKTSLLQAGLVHAVRRDGLAGSDGWKIVSLRPGYRPALALIGAVFGGTAGDSTTLDPKALGNALASALRGDEWPLLVVFDQFEEVFTLARDKAEVQLLTDALADAVEHQRDRFRLVLGMRSEFLGQAASVPRLSRLIRRPWVLRPPSVGDLRDIVAGPAEQCGYTFQGPLSDGNPAHAVGLLDRIIADPLLARDKGTESAPLPLLQFALERLWLKAVEKGGTEFTHAVFDEIGGMGKAIAQHAEAVYQAAATATEAGAAARGLAEQVITALVSAKGTRLPRPRDALQAETGSPEAARSVVDYLVGERLLTVRSDPEDMSRSLVDLSHEALIQNWDRLKGWLAEDPQGRAMREEFRTAAEKWEAGFAGVPPRSRFGLPGADVAANYLAWVRASRPKLPPAQQEFVAAVGAVLARQRRIRRAVLASLSGLAVAASLLALYAIDRAEKARQSEASARTSEEKAVREERLALERSAALTLDHGVRLCEQGRARIGLLSIADSPARCPADAHDLRRVIRTNLAGWAPHLMCLDEARQFPGPAVAGSSDGRVALITVVPGVVRLFDTDTGLPVGPRMVPGEGNAVWGEVIRAGDEWVVLTYGSRTARLWHGAAGRPHGRVIEPDATAADAERGEILFGCVRPDGRAIALGTSRGVVRVWDVEGGQAVGRPLRHEGRIHDMCFTPDGRMLLTGCSHRSGDPLLPDAAARVPAGDAARAAGVARFWDLSGSALDWCHAMANPVTSVGVSPDGRYLAAGGFAVDVYDRHTQKLTAGRIVDDEPANWTAFDPKEPGTMFMTRASGDAEILRVLDATPQTGERLAPQGLVVAAIDGAGRVLLWRAATGEVVGRPIAHAVPGGDEKIRAVAFSPDGARLVTQSFRARGVWDAATAAEVDLLHNPVGVQLSRFSPCGRLVLSATNFNMAQMWDVAGRSARPAALLHAAQVWGVTASADGASVLTASYDRTARSWDAATGKPLSPPLVHGEGVSDVVYSPDGRRVLTGSWDRTARLWRTVAPVPDEVERVAVWAETMTGLRIGPTGSADLLTADEWNRRKRRLDELGGPPWTHVRPGE